MLVCIVEVLGVMVMMVWCDLVVDDLLLICFGGYVLESSFGVGENCYLIDCEVD